MRTASKLGPSAEPVAQGAARTVASSAAGRRPSPRHTDTFRELRDLCALRDDGTLSEAQFAPRNAALLQSHSRRLSTKSPLLICGNDSYAEQRAASW
jgi:hypothetical protein